jgi:uncharacterized repeat protein (TIGR01451 family)
MGITMGASPNPVNASGPLTYTLEVRNHGTGPCEGVRIVDILPPGVTNIDAPDCSISGNTVTCNLGTMAAGSSATRTIAVNAPTTPDTITITNQARVEVEARSDVNLSNNTATATTEVMGFKVVLANKFAPILVLANDDYQVEPVTIMTDSAALRLITALGRDPIIAETGRVNTSLLCRLSSISFPSQALYLDLMPMLPELPLFSSGVLDEPEYLGFYYAIEKRYDPTVYARVVEFPDRNRTVVQYWFFYFFDDWWNNHEGDWEQITLVFESSNAQDVLRRNLGPAQVAYSQHTGGTRRYWVADGSHRQVMKVNSHPLVFVGRGSHANYFEPRLYVWPTGIDDARSPWTNPSGTVFIAPDSAPIPVSGVQVLRYGQPSLLADWVENVRTCNEQNSWLKFDGRWGQAFPGDPTRDGPKGPAFQGKTWNDPVGWVESLSWDWEFWLFP